jgi:hypothetical protein
MYHVRVLYVRIHGRLGVIFMYVLGEELCLHTRLLPIELETRRSRKLQRQGFYTREGQSACILVFPFV